MEEYGNKTLLRLVTTGSVDDGKSTLIGRLLYETGCIYDDQFRAVEAASKRRGNEEVDLSLLLDGLSAEREQKITIDVAYRYFSTPKRKFIIADSPGHEQYTRNMVTGASTADLAIILIDARSGVLTQSKRHGFIVSLLQIPHLIVAVNKMDLVGWSQEVFERISEEYMEFSEKLDIHDITCIPVSARQGDTIVRRSVHMPWYNGHTLLHILENVHVSADRNLVDFRFPVQHVIRPHLDFRGYAGRVASGTIRVGEEIVALPSGKSSSVKTIETFDGRLQECFAGQSVVMTLDDEIDISRGDSIVRKNNLPQTGNRFEAMICWMDEQPMVRSGHYLVKHTTRKVKAFITRIVYTIDVNTLHRQKASTLNLNEIGRVEVQTAQPLFFDPYKLNHATGSFILIDPITNHTAAAGMIRGVVRSADDISFQRFAQARISPNVSWEIGHIEREQWERRNGHKAVVIWFTGLSGSGKSTVARKVMRLLFDSGRQVMLLDGDNVRHGLCGDLGFSDKDRSENIRRVGETAKLFFGQGNIVLCTFISPFHEDRQFVRSILPQGRFIEVYVKCDIGVCRRRDPKKLYEKAESGEIPEFTGVTSSYEEPQKPDIIIETDILSVEECAGKIIKYLSDSNIAGI